MRYRVLRERRYRAIGGSTIAQNVGKATTQIGLGLGLRSLGPLLLGEIIGRLAAFVSLVQSDKRTETTDDATATTRGLRVLIHENRNFPLFSLPSAILDTLGGVLMVPMIAAMYGANATGQVVLAFQVTAFPMAIIGRSVADSFHAVIADAYRGTPHSMIQLFRSTFMMMGLVAVGPVALLVFLGPSLFRFVFGAQWGTAGSLAGYLMLGAAAQLMVSPLSRAMVVLNGQRLKLVYDFLSICLTVGIITVGHRAGMSLAQSVLVLSLSQVGAYALYFWLIRRVILNASELCAA
jgi:O-antigen/teichoic acid export membrane protein